MEPSAKMEKRKVLMGSAALYSGCRERYPSVLALAPRPLKGDLRVTERAVRPVGSRVQLWVPGRREQGRVRAGRYLEVDEDGGGQNPKALQEVPQHVHKGCPDTGVP